MTNALPSNAGGSAQPGLAADATGMTSAASAAAYPGGSDAPEITEVKVGFLPLTDCASVVMAAELGFDRKYGIKIIPTREASWAGVRDKLVSGELDFAQVLYGLVYGVHLGLGGPKKDMAVLMTLNQNGQGLSLSRKLADQGAVNLASLVDLMHKKPRDYVFAQTFPTGTHAMWLNYWLASAGVNPVTDVKTIVVPPPQMVSSARLGAMDGFSVGEPWNHRGIIEGVSIHAASSQDVWANHPEKVLGSTQDFVKTHPNTARAVTMAVLEASRWIDASPANRQKMAETIASKAYVNTPVNGISERILGRYEDGLGRTWTDPNPMAFHGDGAVNFPYLSDGMWFLTQHKRWGLLDAHPDYLGVAQQINQVELYRQAASALNINLPTSPMRRSTLMDGVVWDGSDPVAYADAFTVRAPQRRQTCMA
ncbi:CmpA/NrtA family ABC transporter substrate-binding protein [Rhodoferax sp.]|uniref:CmpA/NrtA family ABC transporter substrate-binding protein n=1 Tax=Rhodoferax sp. TaxID=50421 RepID=UPI00284C6B8A|nr:CmpA/NrtA family ABC transporter substrate-binding protein [Rhodoferax sp.]MDR3367810.1 CmpA/NrtA family ABC transporter substrate-binding protein [Rhodoferax sp.]